MKKYYIIVLFAISLLQTTNIFGQVGGLNHFVEGTNLQKQGQHQKAISEFEKAIRHEPDNFRYLYSKAVSEFQIRDTDAAIKTLNSVVKLKDDYAPAYVMLGNIERALMNTDKAAIHYDLAAKYETNEADKVKYKTFVVNKYIKDKNMKVAYEKSKDLKEMAPKDMKIAYTFARVANSVGKYAEAKAALQPFEPQFKADAKDGPKMYYELGYSQYFLEDFAGSKTSWEKAGPNFKAKVDKFSARHLCNVAMAYFKFYENEQSTTFLDQAEKVEKGYAQIYAIKAQIMKRHHKTNLATIPHFENAAKIESNPAKKQATCAKIVDLYMEVGDYNAALKNADEALKLNATDYKTMLLKANALFKLNKMAETITVCQDALKQNIEPAIKADFMFLMGLAARRSNNNALAKQAFVPLMKSSLRPGVEEEMKSMPDSGLEEEGGEEKE